ncbi:hypothetical protein Kpol_1002p20 [Vanderwaltozyma polyspora DSM 70294]|uniref:Uncharacterized protein n=1 Tax=Vanderwaltozyma polyspora (strain ATCC 22028 / DSM 70294 / BCRC 21397 / CBS 2163 / NBRC 10782 / NRRL Y-8283 / UCD 57-17) TaxID=436907 RepID=A7TE52_VANPO|nr:uncharacterized protein Kpol_1002p20 [Vanderwaltozyma polyspora DSM 70294]EDO19374.1 hypothetical protein Kpol_1002p20 [Vanderwaltozyma polyspora DSM 70294]
MCAAIITKSFQNCSESEVPGYNDCPSFLFDLGTKRNTIKDNKIIDNVPYMYGKKLQANVVAPPPPMKRRVSRRTSSTSSLVSSSSSVEFDHLLAKDEILSMISQLLNTQSRLSSKEFDFYRRKIDSNISGSLDHESTRHILTQFFTESKRNRANAETLLRNWMITDITISNWSPALLKVFENTIV